MAKNALALRMKYRKLTEDQLNEIINNPESDEMEVKIAQETLEKKAGSAPKTEETEEKEEKKAPVKKAPKKADKKVEEPEEEEAENPSEEEDTIKEDPKKGAKPIGGGRHLYEADPEHKLSKEEEKKLKAAEKEFDESQKNRKTPSKKDKAMANEEKGKKEEKTVRETKRQNLDESEECPGMKVGSKVCLKGSSTVGEITRIYKSSDGKEKCMVKFGDDKPIKKRVTALELKK